MNHEIFWIICVVTCLATRLCVGVDKKLWLLVSSVVSCSLVVVVVVMVMMGSMMMVVVVVVVLVNYF